MLKPERKKIRLENYDYSAQGAYFITVCLQNRETLFENDDAKQMVEKWILEIKNKYKNTTIDYYVVMKDHIHMIIFIEKENKTTLFEIIKWFKTMTTNAYIRGVRQGIYKPFENKLWQRSYYEHIIRNDEDLTEKREYILNNPLKELENTENGMTVS